MAELRGRKFLISIDYGTKTLAAAYRLFDPREAQEQNPVPPTTVHDVWFDSREHHGSAPQMVALTDGGKTFHWGLDLEKSLKSNAIHAEQTFEFLKLALYPNHATAPLVQSLGNRLQAIRPGIGLNEILTELIAKHLVAIMAEIQRNMKSQPLSTYTDDEVEELPKVVFLSVPQMWHAPANRIMTEAADLAGFDYLELVYEPQCAVAWFTAGVQLWKPTQINTGDVLLVADIGGGTGDFVSYQLKTSSKAGASVQLEIFGTPRGELCGSEFVNQSFLYWLRLRARDKFDSWEDACAHLGLSEEEVCMEASSQFERLKLSFSDPDEEKLGITIPAATGPQDHWYVAFNGRQMQKFFEPSVNAIIESIREQIVPRTKWLIVPGGYGRSTYLMQCLRKEFENENLKITNSIPVSAGTNQPVARGALLRYNDILPRELPSTESFGIGMTEVWDPILHPDATLPDGTADMTKVEKDEDCGVKNVYQRWNPFANPGEAIVPGKIYRTEAWQQHIVELDQKTLPIQVFWTRNVMQNHGPMVKGTDAESSGLIDGIVGWGKPLTMKIPVLADHGFDIKVSEEGDALYEFFSRMTLVRNRANVHIDWEIAAPDTQPYTDGKPNGNVPKILMSDNFTICNEAFSHVPRSGHE